MLARKHWEQLRQIIKESDLKSAGDVYALLKDSFKDLLQELLEAELDVSLGYDKNETHGIETDNKRNGHTPKTVKVGLGSSSWIFQEIGTGSLNQRSYQSIAVISQVLKRK